jgi:hypothetical protein
MVLYKLKVKKGLAGSNLNRRGACRIFGEIGDNKPALNATAVADFERRPPHLPITGISLLAGHVERTGSLLIVALGR